MFDPDFDLFGQPAGPPSSGAAYRDPMDQLLPADKWSLASPEVQKSSIGRRILGLPPLPPKSPSAGTAAGAANADISGAGSSPPVYEVFSGWHVPATWDLRDIGEAALRHSQAADRKAAAPPPPPSSDAAIAKVDKRRAEGGRSIDGQVKAAKALRREAGKASGTASPAVGDTRPLAPRPGVPVPSGSTQRSPLPPAVKAASAKAAAKVRQAKRPGAVIASSAPGSKPARKMSAADWNKVKLIQQAKENGPRQAKPTRPTTKPRTDAARDLVTGRALDLSPDTWRVFGAEALAAREGIKQDSIRAERDFGDNRAAHGRVVTESAQRRDAALPGYTEPATFNSAVGADRKFQASRARHQAAARYRTQYRTFRREAAHARDPMIANGRNAPA